MQEQQHYFPVWSISRHDVASALSGERDHGPEWWPHQLTDAQMDAIATRMQKYLEGLIERYWGALLDAVIQELPAHEQSQEGVAT